MLRNFAALLLFALTLNTFNSQAQWHSLFDGKTLRGWHTLNGQARYEVVDGQIVGTSVANTGNSFLVTDRTYRDFVLELDFKIDAHTNSGIQVRSESRPDFKNGKVHGYQIEIDPSRRSWTGGIYDEGRREWLYPLEYNSSAKSAFHQDTWNHLRAECIGNTIRAWINDIPTAHLVDDLTSEGFIALQVHSANKPEEVGQQVSWKNIRIQTEQLVASPWDDIFVANFIPNQLSEQEKRNGVRLLWDGRTSTGWRGSVAQEFPAARWVIQQGVLQTKGEAAHATQHADLISEESFNHFDLQFEFKLTSGANSGVKYFVQQQPFYQGPALGFEYQILDNDFYMKAPLNEKAEHGMGALYDLIPADKSPRGIHLLGEWNSGRIICRADKTVEHWLNGYRVMLADRTGADFMERFVRSKYAGIAQFAIREQGYILLQDHDGVVAFRSIKLKELP